ncbi:MAG: hypothetical protein ACOYBT_09965 [Polynucleobacter sp.]
MAHPETPEAVDAPVDDMDSAAAAIGKLMSSGEEPKDESSNESQPEGEGEPHDGDLELEGEEQEDEGKEPASPAIDAPVSLTAEEKAKFAQLSPEAQRYVAELEGRRANQVQTATTKAAEAQRSAETSAARADAQAKAVYAQQLKAFADNLAPQRPDPMLAQTDPATFIALNAQYDAAKAQHEDFVQQVQALGQSADQQLTETEIAERDRALLAIPEVQNEDTRNAFFERGIGVAKTLGLDMAGLNSATAGEWKALHQVSGWKDKADKYDAAMARQMQRVREGRKANTAKPNAAQPSSGEKQGVRDARQRLAKSGDVRDAAALFARLG